MRSICSLASPLDLLVGKYPKSLGVDAIFPQALVLSVVLQLDIGLCLEEGVVDPDFDGFGIQDLWLFYSSDLVGGLWNFFLHLNFLGNAKPYYVLLFSELLKRSPHLGLVGGDAPVGVFRLVVKWLGPWGLQVETWQYHKRFYII